MPSGGYIRMVQRITSRDNARVKYAKSLAKSAELRAEGGLCFAEGVRLCLDLAQTLRPHTLFCTESVLQRHPQLEGMADELYIVGEPVDDKLAETKSPQGLYALFELPWAQLEDIDLAAGVVLCEDVQDPANVGAVIRSAAAFGLGGVVLAGACADAFAPRALRASMGAAARLPVARAANAAEAAFALKQRGAAVYAAALGGAQEIGQQPPQRPFVLLVGNEGAGLSEEALAAADRRVCIPMHRGVESLNAAVAAGVLMFWLASS